MTNPQTTDFAAALAEEKVRLESRLDGFRYMNAYGVPLEEAIIRETERLNTMKKLQAVNVAIDAWVKNPPAREMVKGDLYA